MLKVHPIHVIRKEFPKSVPAQSAKVTKSDPGIRFDDILKREQAKYTNRP